MEKYPQWMPSVASNSQFDLALKSEKIGFANHDNISGAIRYCIMISGVRGVNVPTQEAFDFLKIFIIRNYPGHTVDEIRLSFDLAIAGKLDVDAKCYENFSCEYFGRIMTAYRKWAINEAKNLPVITQEPQAAPKEADWSNVWADVLEAAKAGRIETKIIALPIYDWLVETGKLKLNTDDKKVLWLNAKNKLQAELATLVQMGSAKPNERAEWETIRDGRIEGELYDKISNRAKIQAVRDYAKSKV